MSALPKPVLRGHLGRSGLRILAGAIAFSAATATMYKFLVGVPREKAYQDYIRTYDPEKHYDELVKYGLLQSVKMAKEKKK